MGTQRAIRSPSTGSRRVVSTSSRSAAFCSLLELASAYTLVMMASFTTCSWAAAGRKETRFERGRRLRRLRMLAAAASGGKTAGEKAHEELEGVGLLVAARRRLSRRGARRRPVDVRQLTKDAPGGLGREKGGPGAAVVVTERSGRSGKGSGESAPATSPRSSLTTAAVQRTPLAARTGEAVRPANQKQGGR